VRRAPSGATGAGHETPPVRGPEGARASSDASIVARSTLVRQVIGQVHREVGDRAAARARRVAACRPARRAPRNGAIAGQPARTAGETEPARRAGARLRPAVVRSTRSCSALRNAPGGSRSRCTPSARKPARPGRGARRAGAARGAGPASSSRSARRSGSRRNSCVRPLPREHHPRCRANSSSRSVGGRGVASGSSKPRRPAAPPPGRSPRDQLVKLRAVAAEVRARSAPSSNAGSR